MQVEHDKYKLAQQIAKMQGVLKKHGVLPQAFSNVVAPSSPPSPSLSADLLQHDKIIKQELEDHPFTLPSPQDTLDPRSSFSSASSSSSRSPSPSHLDLEGNASSSDMTQHPAAMLCGLQCQSEAAWRPSTILDSPPDEAQCQRMYTLYILTTLHLYLTLLSAVSSTLLHPLSQLFISLKTGLPLKQTMMTPMVFRLIQWLISTPVNPLTSAMKLKTHSSLSTSTISTAKTNLISSPHRRSRTFRTSLLRRLLACSPALARPLKDATGWALQMKTSYALRGKSLDGFVERDDIGKVSGCAEDTVASTMKGDAWRGDWEYQMTMAATLNVIEERNPKGRR